MKQEPVATTTPVLQACAANMAVRRNLFEALGGFDERLPAGWEDTEICWRAWLRGWPTLYVPDATCWHKASATSRTQDGSEVRFRGAVIGRLVFATRHLPWEHVLATWMASALGAIMTLARGRLTEAIERLKLIARCSTMAPDLLRDRSGLYRRGGKTPRAHFRVMMRLGSR